MHHGVEISDAALVTAAVYSARYISDRFLPDKAIDLVDEAASALRLAQESKPDALEALDRAIVTLQIELASLRNESDVVSVERREAVEEALREKRKEAAALTEAWQEERKRIERVKDVKQRLEAAKYALEVAQREGRYEEASKLRFATIPELERQLPTEQEAMKADVESAEGPIPMLHERVTSDDVARVVAKATGIPVQSLLKGEKEKLVHVRPPVPVPVLIPIMIFSLCVPIILIYSLSAVPVPSYLLSIKASVPVTDLLLLNCLCPFYNAPTPTRYPLPVTSDGRCASGACRRAGPRRQGSQRRRPVVSRRSSTAQPSRCVVPLPWTDGCRQGKVLVLIIKGSCCQSGAN